MDRRSFLSSLRGAPLAAAAALAVTRTPAVAAAAPPAPEVSWAGSNITLDDLVFVKVGSDDVYPTKEHELEILRDIDVAQRTGRLVTGIPHEVMILRGFRARPPKGVWTFTIGSSSYFPDRDDIINLRKLLRIAAANELSVIAYHHMVDVRFIPGAVSRRYRVLSSRDVARVCREAD